MKKKAFVVMGVLLLVLLPLVVAGSSAQSVTVTPVPYPHKPNVAGTYNVKCSIKVDDWSCTRKLIIKEGNWLIKQDPQNPDKISCTLSLNAPGLSILKELPADKGYVGPIVRNPKGKVINKPRLSQMGEKGRFCEYTGAGTALGVEYVTWIINAQVFLDPKTGMVKSINGNIKGWGEFGPQFPPALCSGPSLGQFEGTFVATPVKLEPIPTPIPIPPSTPTPTPPPQPLKPQGTPPPVEWPAPQPTPWHPTK